MATEHGSSFSTATNSASSPSSISSASSVSTSVGTNAVTTPASSPTFVFGSTRLSSLAHLHPLDPNSPLFCSTTPLAPPLLAPTADHLIFHDLSSNHIKFLLDPAEHNFHKWKAFFLMVFIDYGMTYLIEHPSPPNADSLYLELYAHVTLGVYSTLVDSLIDHVIGRHYHLRSLDLDP